MPLLAEDPSHTGNLPPEAATLSALLQNLYWDSEGFSNHGHPGFKRLAAFVCQHGRMLWDATSRSISPESLLVRSWLRDLATAPAREWAQLRLDIMPLVRWVADPPRSAGSPLLTQSYDDDRAG